MEWTYCLECGAPQFPGAAACPECSACADPGETEVSEAPVEPTTTWVGVLQSIWVAQLLAAAGGLLLALVVGIGLGYASRTLNRPVSADSTRPAPRAGVQVAAARTPAEPLPTVSQPAVVVPVEVPSAAPAAAQPDELAAFVGPPRPLVGPPVELSGDGWELEGVRPPPEHWLRLPYANQHATARLPVYEPLPPSVQLYGRYLPGPSTVEIQWQIDTPREWQGAMFTSPRE